MAYMNRNVNLILLLLIIILVGYLIGLSTYYEGSFKNLSISYNSKVNQISKLSENLSYNSFQLNKTFSELQLRVADKTKFDQMYTELTTAKTRLETELSQTQSELATTKAGLRESENQLLTTRSDLASVQSQLSTKQATIDSLNNQVDDLDSKLAACTSKCP